jgi:hypothetical protein
MLIQRYFLKYGGGKNPTFFTYFLVESASQTLRKKHTPATLARSGTLAAVDSIEWRR